MCLEFVGVIVCLVANCVPNHPTSRSQPPLLYPTAPPSKFTLNSVSPCPKCPTAAPGLACVPLTRTLSTSCPKCVKKKPSQLPPPPVPTHQPLPPPIQSWATGKLSHPCECTFINPSPIFSYSVNSCPDLQPFMSSFVSSSSHSH